MQTTSISKVTSELPVCYGRELSPAENRYVELSKGGKVSQIEPKEMYDFSEGISKGILCDIVKSVIFSSGQSKLQQEDFRALVFDFYNKLMIMNRHTSIDDIREALTLGVCHKLKTEQNPDGKYFGINVATFFDWINTYLFQQERLQAIQKIAYVPSKKTDTIDTNQANKIFNNSLDFSFNHYVKTGEVIDHGNGIFNGLWRRGKIRLSEEEKNAELETTVNEIGKRLTAKLNAPSINRNDHADKKKLSEQLEDLSIDSPEVVSETKNRLLKTFFDKIINESKET